ncbi:rubisco accumulation factor 1.1, chloroplastic [Beta vulgaris subsp. vulgaris]|uniref:rubisco accumulation factor 1.1, chloroplastic n=1 Tax=Beta vulgaris subsp. vulgaris TaxID=3555 RepID=UPI002037187A|nr:rubisco accumulation factor 1.1, chloroplastic [Beta vulgaris subsp. vulgaris]
MLSLSSPKPPSLSFSSTLFSTTKLPLIPTTPSSLRQIIKPTSKLHSANSPPPIVPNLIIPSSSSPSPQPQNLYQPFRPPPNPLPQKYKNLDTASIIDVLANRLGLWYEYAPLISSLFRDGFTPPSIEELTGITGVDQNRLVVAAQVRETIADSPDLDPETLAFFESGGSELLYEIRLLSTSQRAATANYVVRNKLDGEKTREVARAIKDFPRGKEEVGWRCFDYTKPGDCWAFWLFRLSREFINNADKRSSALTAALEAAETDRAREAINEEIHGKVEEIVEEIMKEAVKVPVVRLRMGEVAEATSVVVLPVCEAVEGESGVGSVPLECRSDGHFGIVKAEKGWDRWVVLPRWAPVAEIGGGGVVVSFRNAKVLPWKVNRTYVEEPILVVADRGRREIEYDDGFYLVAGMGDDGYEGGLKLERGSALKNIGVSQCLGTVVIVVRPPRDEGDDQLISDEDWD